MRQFFSRSAGCTSCFGLFCRLLLCRFRCFCCLSLCNLRRFLTRGKLLRRDDAHRSFNAFSKAIECTFKIDKVTHDVHTEEIVCFVFVHEDSNVKRRKRRNLGLTLDDSFDATIDDFIAFDERVVKPDGIVFFEYAHHLSQLIPLLLIFARSIDQVFKRKRDKRFIQFHNAYAPFFFSSLSFFDFSSRMPIPSTTASMIASGRIAQPGAYTSTGIALSTPPMML